MKRLAATIALQCVAGLTVAAEQDAPRSQPPQLLAEGLGETALALVMVVLLILALSWLFKRFGSRLPMAAKGPVQVVGGVSLGTRERAVLLSVDGVRVLVGVAPGQVRALHVLDGSASAEQFSERLQQAQQETQQ